MHLFASLINIQHRVSFCCIFTTISCLLSDYMPDFIIHMETISEDTLCFLNESPRIDVESLSKLRHVNMSPMGHSGSQEIQQKYFSQLNEELLKQIQNKYWPDFLLHGYELTPFLKMLK